MAQLRAEVRPNVTNMPVDGFGMQTGGSARRRVVPFDTAMNSYKVTGVPGHTHNASAVCSVLVDNTERSHVDLTIRNHFAHTEVVLAAPRYTDSAVVDESDYDRAIERGIGEIAIVPENCHQEIREPARDIYELRTLVMPKDKRDTLTYVEEVGGFVSQSTGEVPSPEPAYPDVQVDLFHSYELPAAAAIAPNPGVGFGTGNVEDIDGELRFKADDGAEAAQFQWTRGAVNDPSGPGTSFVPLKLADQPLATVAGQPWDGVVTLQWDPDNKVYSCDSFEAVFTSMHVSYWDAQNAYQAVTTANFEVQFPEISTTVSRDGQCFFAKNERPLVDETSKGLEIRCTVDQTALPKAIFEGVLRLEVYPFRIATGYSSAIRGPDRGTNFWSRVRNTTPAVTATAVQGSVPTGAMYINNNADPPVKDANDDRMLQGGVVTHYATLANVYPAHTHLPRIYARNGVSGTSYDMLPTDLARVPAVFGPVYGLNYLGGGFNPAVNILHGVRFLDAAMPAHYDADGHRNADLADADWAADARFPEAYRTARVERRIDTDLLLSRLDANTIEEFAEFAADDGELANNNDDVRFVTKTIAVVDPTTGLDEHPANENEVVWQSEAHWAAVGVNLGHVTTHRTGRRATAQAIKNAHELNLGNVRLGHFPTNAVGGTAPAAVYAVAVPVVANTGNVQADAATNAANVAAAVHQVRPVVERQLQDAKDTLAAAEQAVRAAVDAQANHAAGSGFVYGASENDDKHFMFKLEASALSVVLPYTQPLEAEVTAHRFSQHNTLTVPCTVRYMFNDKMMVWNLNAGNVPIGNAAAATPPTLSNMYWGTRNLGQEIDSATGAYQQQESAPFRVFCEPTEVANGAPGAGGTALVEMDFGSLFDVRSIHQDFPETVAANWLNQAGNNNVEQDVSTRRNNAAGRAITVMSVGIMDNLQSNSQMGEHARAAKTKHDVFTLMADFGSTCIMRVAHGFVQQHNVNTGVRPIMTVLGNADEVQPLNRDRLSVMGGRRPFNQPVLMTPHFVNHHNTQANARPLEYAQDTIYLGNVYFSYPKNRRVFVVFNDRGADLAAPRPPTTMVFETDDCEPILHFDEFYNFANVMTRVRHVRFLDGADPWALDAFVVPDAAAWTAAFLDANVGQQGAQASALNKSWCTVIVTSSDFQDTYWNEDPFRQIIDDAQQTGVVHRSRLRVSQHLCAPLLNPNRRIGCSAPLNYDSLHLPPELRDFRIELRDIDFSFLPGNTEKATLEPLTIYEFNGGNQVPGTQNALLYMPHFRSFQTTTVSQAFELDVFSPYGNPSYICLFARSKLRPAEYIKQPLIKTLTIKSNTTMKKSNTVLDAREHELFHLSQRNVHPRAEYTRISNQKRQVVLLCAEDIGDMGIPEYQKEKRAQFELSGTLDVPATVTALFIYNNRGLSIRNMEIGVVRL